MAKFGVQAMAVGRWEIDRSYGLEVLARYANDVALINSGATTAKELYTERRKNESVVVLQPSENSVEGRSALTDETHEVGSIAHLTWSGVMLMDGGLCSQGIREFTADLRSAANNPSIAGILLEIDSGGGQSTAGHELMNTVADIRSQVPVVVYTHMLASAALRGTLTADRVYAASRSTVVGSIGTYVSIGKKELKALSKSMEIYAEQSTMKNEGERALKEGDSGPLQEFVTRIARGFIEDVQQYRLLRGTTEQVAEVLAGKTLTADEGVERGLIDGIATLSQAVEHLRILISNQSAASKSTSAAYSTNSDMKFTELIKLLREKVGLEVPVESSYDDVLSALEGMKSLEEVREEISAAAEEQTGELRSAIDELKETLRTQGELISTLKEESATNVRDLQRELAGIKGERVDDTDETGKASEKVNDKAPDRTKFETVKSFDKQTGIKSKY